MRKKEMQLAAIYQHLKFPNSGVNIFKNYKEIKERIKRKLTRVAPHAQQVLISFISNSK